MGGPGIQPQAAQRSQGGSMGILMPLYTIGIIVFFVYTVFKVRHILIKNGDLNNVSFSNIGPLCAIQMGVVYFN